MTECRSRPTAGRRTGWKAQCVLPFSIRPGVAGDCPEGHDAPARTHSSSAAIFGAGRVAPSGIRVNAVAPALIGATHFHQRFTPAQAFENVVKTIPLGRAGTPEDVARVIAFLASDDSAYLAGETIDISGGLYMR